MVEETEAQRVLCLSQGPTASQCGLCDPLPNSPHTEAGALYLRPCLLLLSSSPERPTVFCLFFSFQCESTQGAGDCLLPFISLTKGIASEEQWWFPTQQRLHWAGWDQTLSRGRREGAKGDTAALSSKGPSGCRASGGTCYVQLPRNVRAAHCHLPQLRRQQNVSVPLIGRRGSFHWLFVHLSDIHCVYPWNI